MAGARAALALACLLLASSWRVSSEAISSEGRTIGYGDLEVRAGGC